MRRAPLAPLLLLATAIGLGGCRTADPVVEPAPPAAPPVPAVPTDAPPGPLFVDLAPAGGLVHPVVCGGPEKGWLLEANGTGAAVLDANGDGRLDLYVVHCATMDRPHDSATPNRLYVSRGDGTYAEWAAELGVDDRGWGSGALAWDYDGDGDTDLFVTNVGPDHLYRNDGGRFLAVEAEAGLGDHGWSIAAAAADYDLDGDLDLFVSHYMVFDPADPTATTTWLGCEWKGAATACGPLGLEPAPDRLYRNDGDGTFTDVSAELGIHDAAPGYGMAVVWLDADGDGRPDVYVANDAVPNHLFLQQEDGRFVESGRWTGLATGPNGVPQGSMGIATGDLDGDGRDDLVVTNFSEEENAIYRDLGGFFEERGWMSGTSQTFANLAWGATFLDVESDGDLDLLVANGHVYPQVDAADPGTSYRQADQLFLNPGSGALRLWEPPAVSPLAEATSSRGLVRVDLEDDGDSDVLIVSLDAPPRLLRNDTPREGSWIGFELVGTRSSRDPAGARVRVRSGGLEQVRALRLGSSFASSEDPRPLFGLGSAEGEVEVEVEWPRTGLERFGTRRPGSYHRLVEGEGSSPTATGR